MVVPSSSWRHIEEPSTDPLVYVPSTLPCAKQIGTNRYANRIHLGPGLSPGPGGPAKKTAKKHVHIYTRARIHFSWPYGPVLKTRGVTGILHLDPCWTRGGRRWTEIRINFLPCDSGDRPGVVRREQADQV